MFDPHHDPRNAPPGLGVDDGALEEGVAVGQWLLATSGATRWLNTVDQHQRGDSHQEQGCNSDTEDPACPALRLAMAR